MTQQQNLTNHESPASIRSEVFAHRMRGLDEAEVREYLDILADQVEAADAVRASQRSEIEQLRSENRRLQEEMEQSSTEISPQAVALFSQAQQVADQLVEEAVTHARDLMMSARHQQRDIIQRAHDSAEQVAKRTGAHDMVTGVRSAAVDQGYTTPVPEIEYVRTFARVAQVQLRSVLDALNDQVDRLSEVPQLESAGNDLGSERAIPPPRRAASEHPLGAARDGDREADDESASLYEQIWSMQGRGID
ncbi:MAG: DivIVA domain-containing protein [Nocardioides sp.]